MVKKRRDKVENPGTAIRPHLTVKELVRQYEAAERDIIAGCALINGAVSDLSDVCFDKIYLCDYHGRSVNLRHKDVLVGLRRQVWGYIIERLDIRRVMSVAAWEKLNQQLNDHREDPPPITEEMVSQMAAQYRNKIPEMLEEAIVEVFDWLRPWRGDYKTNSREVVGPKVILEYVVDDQFLNHWKVNYNYKQRLSALERVFKSLDGKGQTTDHYTSNLEEAISKTPKTERGGETEYFKFKCYLNRNLHVEFKRKDLLAKFNAIAGGSNLRSGDRG